jgi:hypothetical protein
MLAMNVLFPVLFALSTGVFPNDALYARGRIRAVIRHQEGPLPVEMLIRTTNKDNPSREDWEYIEDIKHFPKKVIANPIGRRITVTLPTGLKKYSQLCSFYEPDSAPQETNGFQVRFSLESCANVYQPKQ